MLKILQAKLHKYVNWKFTDVQAEFRNGRGTKDQIANIRWIIDKAKEFPKSIYVCFTDYTKAFDCVDHNKLENSQRDWKTLPLCLPPEKLVFRSRSNRKNPMWKWQPDPIFLPRESHGQTNLVGYSPCSSKESHVTEQLTHTWNNWLVQDWEISMTVLSVVILFV